MPAGLVQGSVSEGTGVGRTGRAQAHTGLQVSAKAKFSAEALHVQDSEKRGHTPATWPSGGGPEGPFRVSICAEAEGPKRLEMIPVGDGLPGPHCHPTSKATQVSSRVLRLAHPVRSSVLPIHTLGFCLEKFKAFQWTSQLSCHPLWSNCISPWMLPAGALGPWALHLSFGHLSPPKLPSLTRAVHANKTLPT